jgi:large subunit ribosomal protein L13
MKTTQFVRKEDVIKTWYLIDAADLPVGRIATMAAYVLRGKHRPDFTPHIDNGDHLIIVNAERVRLTGRKLENKNYYRHSGYHGGLTETSAKQMLKDHPERVLISAVRGMLPKNKLGRKLMKKFRVFAGSEHPHSAQVPTMIEVSEEKYIKAVK